MCRRLMYRISFLLVLGLMVANTAHADLVGWWTFDGNYDDSSGKGNNGTPLGTPTFVDGKLGQAVSLNATGTDQYINCGTNTGITTVGDGGTAEGLTLAMWINRSVASGDQKICGNLTETTWVAGHGFKWAIYNNLMELDMRDSVGRFFSRDVAPAATGPSIATANTWYHIAMVFDDKADTLTEYIDGAAGRVWTAVPRSLLASTSEFRIGTDLPTHNAGRVFRGLMDDLRIYNSVLNQQGIQDVMKGLGPTKGLAAAPSPADKTTDVLRDVVLGWRAGEFAAKHDVYVGTLFADVNDASRDTPKGVLVSQAQDANTYDPTSPFEFNQTYFWRVDEVNAPPTDSTIIRGNVWSFTTEPYGYPVKPIKATASSNSNVLTGPEKTIDGSGLDALDQHSTSTSHMWLSKSKQTPVWIQYDFEKVYSLHQMWVWNFNQLGELDNGFGVKDVTIEVSTDGSTWSVLGGVMEFAQATGEPNYVTNTTVDFGGVLAQYVRLNIQSNWGDVRSSGLSEVRFFYVPLKGFGAGPASGATGVALDATLNWRPGRRAASHEVYLGTDPNALSKIGTVTEHRFDLSSAGLEYDRTYYWKVNEVNEAAHPLPGYPTTWEGDLWSFSTVGYTVVEDFESYNDLCNKIFYTWVDQSGYSAPAECGGASAPGNGSGAIVGNAQAPYSERTIVHGGSQSLPMSFDNKMNPFYSETHREWTTPQVWTAGGANTLRVYFQGEAPAFLETSPGNIVMTGMGTDIWNTADEGRFAYKSLTGDGSIVARVESLANTDPWAKAGVMIRETLDPGSTWAHVLYGGTNGVHFQARLTTSVAAVSDTSLTLPADQTGARSPVWIKVERKGNQFFGYYATDATGTAWTPIIWNPQTITMAPTVYIGLAVTSHATGMVCGAKFSNVSTQGNVTGSWQLADLGVIQPTGGNAPETFYVAVQDGSGKMKVVNHPDPVAIVTGAWEEWNVPLSQITAAGVSLNNVKKLVIGVGDRNAPKAGGAGKVYFDDIRLTREAGQ